ncbi:hypothetical protein K0U27_00265 [archaeon]|nr:hypothetical protein [archaeon]
MSGHSYKLTTVKKLFALSGNRATIASYMLAQEGIDFQILEGGMNSWNSLPQENEGV